jgi:hypothetical protein
MQIRKISVLIPIHCSDAGRGSYYYANDGGNNRAALNGH